MVKPLILQAATCFMVMVSVSFAQAQAPSEGYALGLGWSYAGGQTAAVRVSQQRIPYFALNPPVYYGKRIARPYGYSPFAVPPALLPAEFRPIPKADFKEISNPFFEENPSSEPRTESKGLRQVSADQTT